LKVTDPTMDRSDWVTVRKAFKERWPPLPEPEEDTELKQEELEQMRLREGQTGDKSNVPRPRAIHTCGLRK